MIPTTLLEAYKATCYEIIQPNIEIFIGQENEALQTFLKENGVKSYIIPNTFLFLLVTPAILFSEPFGLDSKSLPLALS